MNASAGIYDPPTLRTPTPQTTPSAPEAAPSALESTAKLLTTGEIPRDVYQAILPHPKAAQILATIQIVEALNRQRSERISPAEELQRLQAELRGAFKSLDPDGMFLVDRFLHQARTFHRTVQEYQYGGWLTEKGREALGALLPEHLHFPIQTYLSPVALTIFLDHSDYKAFLKKKNIPHEVSYATTCSYNSMPDDIRGKIIVVNRDNPDGTRRSGVDVDQSVEHEELHALDRALFSSFFLEFNLYDSNNLDLHREYAGVILESTSYAGRSEMIAYGATLGRWNPAYLHSEAWDRYRESLASNFAVNQIPEAVTRRAWLIYDAAQMMHQRHLDEYGKHAQAMYDRQDLPRSCATGILLNVPLYKFQELAPFSAPSEQMQTF